MNAVLSRILEFFVGHDFFVGYDRPAKNDTARRDYCICGALKTEFERRKREPSLTATNRPQARHS